MMSFVLMWIRANWKPVAITTAIVFIYFFGFYKGYSHEHANYLKHLQDDATAMAVAKAENARKVAEQTEITNRITQEYANAVDKINTYYKSHPNIVRLCGSSETNSLSSQSQSSSGTDQTSHRITQAPATIELDLNIAGKEIAQCQALIEFEKEQDRVQ